MKYDIDSFKQKIPKLKHDTNENRYTTGKSPHKPILLLSFILLNRNNKIDLMNIKSNLELRETWGQIWSCLDYKKPGPIILPLFHLINDGFYFLEPKSGMTIHKPRSLGELTEMTNRIYLRQDVISLFQEEKSRNEIINSLLHAGYFSDAEIQKLRSFITNYDGAFEYEEKINLMLKNEFSMEIKIDEAIKPIRDPAFRRVVLRAYDERCAMCELKLITTSGISVLEAAHILPFSKYHSDDIRNGLSLCKNHHWLFDRGLLTVDKRYRVKISPSIEAEHPEGAISDINRKEILLPEDAKKYPSHIALEWHRKEVFYS